MQALVKRASQHGLKLLSKLLAVIRLQVHVEGFLIRPDFHDGEMVRTSELLEQLEAHVARVLAAIGGEHFQELCTVGGEIGREIDVRDDVQPGVLTEAFRSSRQE